MDRNPIDNRTVYDPVSYVLTPTHSYPPHHCEVIERAAARYQLACGAVVVSSMFSYRPGMLMACPRCTPAREG